ncbi:NUDIX hydrolase [Mycetocola reblochoni]|uniref:NUDIX hydrolase n=1 Tax=Mycetocola reblochoni TaxID=331618 RepID=A0A3L6ZMB5_9MICO|nr:NUDIX hydrolase [Mycetocola reblochoni]RLP68805.1 NUDIX hydrolase [Mycetocola reblochoni]
MPGDDALLADEPTTVTVTRSERVFTGAVWDIRSENFDYNGASIRRDFVDHTGAVAVLALDGQGRVLLIQQYRHPIRSREWEIPAGLLDVAGEDPLAAAKRELAEEADLVAEDWALLTDFATSPGGSDEYVRIYLARGLAAAAEAFERTEEEADIVTRWLPLDEAIAAVRGNRLHNSILQLALLHAHLAAESGWSGLPPLDTPWPGSPRGGR